MALYDAPPFTVDIEMPSSFVDPGGGTAYTFVTRTAGVKGILNSASSGETVMFEQTQLTVSHTFVQFGITTAQRGDQLVYQGRKLRVVGINTNEPMGSIPALSTLKLSELL